MAGGANLRIARQGAQQLRQGLDDAQREHVAHRFDPGSGGDIGGEVAKGVALSLQLLGVDPSGEADRLKADGVAEKVGALLSDPDPDVQHTAAEYGAHLGYKSSLEEIKRFMAGKDFTSHSAAMHLIGTLPQEQAAPLMAAFLHHR